jgi:hypothetical protein
MTQEPLDLEAIKADFEAGRVDHRTVRKLIAEIERLRGLAVSHGNATRLKKLWQEMGREL